MESGLQTEIWPETFEAIEQAIIAGACWRAAVLSPKTADIWNDLAAEHSKRAATLLIDVVERSGV